MPFQVSISFILWCFPILYFLIAVKRHHDMATLIKKENTVGAFLMLWFQRFSSLSSWKEAWQWHGAGEVVEATSWSIGSNRDTKLGTVSDTLPFASLRLLILSASSTRRSVSEHLNRGAQGSHSYSNFFFRTSSGWVTSKGLGWLLWGTSEARIKTQKDT